MKIIYTVLKFIIAFLIDVLTWVRDFFRNLFTPGKVKALVIMETSAMTELAMTLDKNDWQFEQGGIVMGFYNRTRLHVRHFLYCDNVSGNKRKKFYYDKRLYIPVMKEIFIKSKGQIRFLGEWHTHPSGSPETSKDDDKRMMFEAQKNKYCVMLIITKKLLADKHGDINYMAALYGYTKNTKKLVQQFEFKAPRQGPKLNLMK